MNFRKPVSLLLAFFLLVSNVGFAFNVHYCGGEIASITIKTTFSSEKPVKNCCAVVEEKSDCCKNKTLHFQQKSYDVVVDLITYTADLVYLTAEESPIVGFSTASTFKSNSITSYSCDANAPPFFKLYHQLIFYA